MSTLERIARLVRRNLRGLWRLPDFRTLSVEDFLDKYQAAGDAAASRDNKRSAAL